MLKLEHVNKSFGGNNVIQDLSIELKAGNIHALLGANGTGKTTLLNIINGQITHDRGKIYLNHQDVSNEKAFKRANMGVLRLWQHSKIFPNMTVLDNLMVVPENLGEKLLNYLIQPMSVKKEQEKIKENALEILEKLELRDKSKHLGKELSYGQQRLLAFGRIMMDAFEKEGLVILIDEPFAGVHISLIEKISDIIRELSDRGNLILMIEHNIDKVVSFSDEILIMANGKIEQRFKSQNVTPEVLQNIYAAI